MLSLKGGKAGFTLVEVLLTMVLTSTVLLGIWQGQQALFQVAERNLRLYDLEHELATQLASWQQAGPTLPLASTQKGSWQLSVKSAGQGFQWQAQAQREAAPEVVVPRQEGYWLPLEVRPHSTL